MRAILQLNEFIGIGVARNGVDEVAARFCIVALYIGRAIGAKGIEHFEVMVVAAYAEKQIAIVAAFLVKIFSYVLVEEKHAWGYVHGNDGGTDAVGQRLSVLPHETEVGHIARVVVFIGIGVETHDVEEGGVEAEVVITKHLVVGGFAGGEAVVVADRGDIGHLEAVENAALPDIFLGEAEVGHVASVDNEVESIGTAVDVANNLLCLIIEALAVTEVGKAYGVLAGAELLNECTVGFGETGGTVDVYIVRMVLYHVAGAKHKQGEAD